MANLILAPTLHEALRALADRIGRAEARGQRNLVFCEDSLTLLAERAVLERTGGTFLTEVTTFARFLSEEAAGNGSGSLFEEGWKKLFPRSENSS